MIVIIIFIINHSHILLKTLLFKKILSYFYLLISSFTNKVNKMVGNH
jgi:hypothetical protein